MTYKTKPSNSGVHGAIDVRLGRKLIATFYGDTAQVDADYCASMMNFRERGITMQFPKGIRKYPLTPDQAFNKDAN